MNRFPRFLISRLYCIILFPLFPSLKSCEEQRLTWRICPRMSKSIRSRSRTNQNWHNRPFKSIRCRDFSRNHDACGRQAVQNARARARKEERRRFVSAVYFSRDPRIFSGIVSRKCLIPHESRQCISHVSKARHRQSSLEVSRSAFSKSDDDREIGALHVLSRPEIDHVTCTRWNLHSCAPVHSSWIRPNDNPTGLWSFFVHRETTTNVGINASIYATTGRLKPWRVSDTTNHSVALWLFLETLSSIRRCEKSWENEVSRDLTRNFSGQIWE